MALGKMKIILITGISVAVVALGVGLGLWLGLDSGSDSETTSEEPGNQKQQYTTVTGVTVTNEDIDAGKITVDQIEYEITRSNNNFYIKIPENTYSLSAKIITSKVLGQQQGSERIFDDNTEKGKGKNHFYDIQSILPETSFFHGPIRIPGDGKIYGGYVKDRTTNEYKMNDNLVTVFPNGYEIGDFNDHGQGGVNMGKLEELRQLEIKISEGISVNTMDDVNQILADVARITKFGFFLHTEDNKEVIRLVTNSRPEFPRQIGFNPTDPMYNYNYQPDDPSPERAWPHHDDGGQLWGDEDTKPTREELQQHDYTFKVQEFTKQDGTAYEIVLSKNTERLVDAVVDVPLNQLYIPMTITPGFYNHPVLGKIQPDSTGRVHLMNSIETEDGNQPVIEINNEGELILPTLLIKLEEKHSE